MTDITELVQSLKAAAEGVIKNYDCEWFETGRQICTVHKSKVNLISLANPANILALVEALEKAQRTNEYLREQATEWERKAVSNFVNCGKMSERIYSLHQFVTATQSQEKLRELVDLVWNTATESTEVPSTKWADELITKVFGVYKNDN